MQIFIYLFQLSVSLLTALPGVLGVYFGIRVSQMAHLRNVKGAVGCLAICATIYFAARMEGFLVIWLDEYVANALSFLLTTLMIIAVYVLLVSFVLRQEGASSMGWKNLIGPGLTLIVSLQIWVLAYKVFDVASPKNDDSNPHLEIWEWLSFLIPILLAWAFYRITINRLRLGEAEQVAPPEPPPGVADSDARI